MVYTKESYMLAHNGKDPVEDGAEQCQIALGSNHITAYKKYTGPKDVWILETIEQWDASSAVVLTTPETVAAVPGIANSIYTRQAESMRSITDASGLASDSAFPALGAGLALRAGAPVAPMPPVKKQRQSDNAEERESRDQG